MKYTIKLAVDLHPKVGLLLSAKPAENESDAMLPRLGANVVDANFVVKVEIVNRLEDK